MTNVMKEVSVPYVDSNDFSGNDIVSALVHFDGFGCKAKPKKMIVYEQFASLSVRHFKLMVMARLPPLLLFFPPLLLSLLILRTCNYLFLIFHPSPLQYLFPTSCPPPFLPLSPPSPLLCPLLVLSPSVLVSLPFPTPPRLFPARR